MHHAIFQKPIWPLVEFSGFLYMATPFEEPQQLFEEMPFPLELKGSLVYESLECIEPYKTELFDFLLAIKGQFKSSLPYLFDISGQKLDYFSTIHFFFKQIVLEKELLHINSLLCAESYCTLCCEGPSKEAEKLFWEIPLSGKETDLFDCQVISTDKSRGKTSEDELLIDGSPFYELEKPAIIFWSSGPALILPKGVRCPNLHTNGLCKRYETRPYTCKKPQVFSYILDTSPLSPAGKDKNSFTVRNSVLAVWDCPYVKRLKDDIATYVTLCDAEMVFMENKQ